MMNHQVDKMAESWLAYARADLEAARRLLTSLRPSSWTFLLSAWHCYQAIEKTFKRVIVVRGKELFKIHDLVRLYELSGVRLS